MPHNFWTKFGTSGHSDIAHRSQATYLINLASQKNCIKPLIPVHVQSSSKQHIVSSKSNKRICFYGKNHAGSPSQCTKLSFEIILSGQKFNNTVGTIEIATVWNSCCYPGLIFLDVSLGLEHWCLAQV